MDALASSSASVQAGDHDPSSFPPTHQFETQPAELETAVRPALYPVCLSVAVHLALFDVLEGRFGSGLPIDAVSRDEQRVHSIVGNLQRLLNTRQGSVSHLPDYGLPDLSTIHREAPDSFDVLRKAIRAAVMAYEPRLAHVRVEPQTIDPYSMRVQFIISGEVAPGRRIRLSTTFGSQELTEVRPADR